MNPATAAGPHFGSSETARRLRAAAVLASEDFQPVLILGEAGSGKSTLARWIHEAGPRAGQRFVKVPCSHRGVSQLENRIFGAAEGSWSSGGRPEPGWLETARGGTVFLDEIGDLGLPVQNRLFRIFDSGEYQRCGDPTLRRAECRIIGGSRLDLEALAGLGLFDLAFLIRLHTHHVLRIPALRDRREELPALAEAVLEPLGRQRKGRLVLDRGAQEALRRHPWPGNLREFRSRLEQAAAACPGGEIRAEHLALEETLPGVPEATCGPALSRWELERQSIRAALFEAEAPTGLPAARDPVPIPPPAALGSPAPSALYARIKSFAFPDLNLRQRAG